jgi:hypothetical protein
MIKKFLTSITAVIATCVALVAATVMPAQAGITQCTVSQVCFSEDPLWPDGGAAVHKWSWDYIYGLSGHCLNMAAGTYGGNNAAVQIYDHSDVTVRFFDNSGCAVDSSHPGYYTIHAPNFNVIDLQYIPSMYKKISSIYAWNTGG